MTFVLSLQTPQNAASDQGLHYLPVFFLGTPGINGLIQSTRAFPAFKDFRYE